MLIREKLFKIDKPQTNTSGFHPHHLHLQYGCIVHQPLHLTRNYSSNRWNLIRRQSDKNATIGNIQGFYNHIAKAFMTDFYIALQRGADMFAFIF